MADWFKRHRYDYDPLDVKMPPKVWSEYFGYLLSELRAAYARNDLDRARITALEHKVQLLSDNDWDEPVGDD